MTHRVKNIGYDEDDLFDEDDYVEEEQGYSAEDRDNFASLTPVVRVEVEEAGVQVTDLQIEEALWHYYWDVGKSVAFLKGARKPEPDAKKEKPKSKFDEAAQKNAKKAGESCCCFLLARRQSQPPRLAPGLDNEGGHAKLDAARNMLIIRERTDNMPRPPLSGVEWFRNTPWRDVNPEMVGILVPAPDNRPEPKLFGGSTKLAKLAEERRRKAAASQGAPAPPAGSLSSLDRLSKPKDIVDNKEPSPRVEIKKYPIRRKEPSPPPRDPTPPPVEPKEILPDLRCKPTAFGRTLAVSPPRASTISAATLRDMLGVETNSEPFNEPSPDDTILVAQKKSKGMAK
jgi:elongation factor 1 alpha-like protein